MSVCKRRQPRVATRYLRYRIEHSARGSRTTIIERRRRRKIAATPASWQASPRTLAEDIERFPAELTDPYE